MSDNKPIRRIVEQTGPSHLWKEKPLISQETVSASMFWAGWAVGLIVTYWATGIGLSTNWLEMAILIVNGFLAGFIVRGIAVLAYARYTAYLMYTPQTVITTEEYSDGETRRRVIRTNVMNEPGEIVMDGDDFSDDELKAAAVAILVHGSNVSRRGIENATANSIHNVSKISQERAGKLANKLHDDGMAKDYNVTRAGWNWLSGYLPEHVAISIPLPPE